MFSSQHIVNALRMVLPDTDSFIPLHEPWFNGKESEYTQSCIEEGWVSSVGAFVDRFENDLASVTGVKRAVAVVNGTAALHMALLMAGVKENDEVLIPALTFVATANAVAYCGAVPHFVDSEERTLGVDAERLQSYLTSIASYQKGECINKLTGRPIRCIVPMHTFGHPVDMDPLLDIAKKYDLVVVEDAAESLGSYYKNRHTGGFGKMAVLSFNGNKIITTGGGGAVLTNDEALADRVKHLTTTAKRPHRWQYFHDETGFNYRLPNLNAALGCAQLEQLDYFIRCKRALAGRYAEILAEVDGISFIQEPDHCRSNYWLNGFLLEKSLAAHRDELLDVLNQNNIMARPAWDLINTLPMYRACPRMELEVAADLSGRLINIPSGAILGVPYA